jgi:hypothetical protein
MIVRDLFDQRDLRDQMCDGRLSGGGAAPPGDGAAAAASVYSAAAAASAREARS